MFSGCSAQVRSGGPMTKEEALLQSECMLPLPPSAHNVYFYLIDRGSQDHDLFLRFNADATDIANEIKEQWEFRSSFAKSRGRVTAEPTIDKTNFQQRKTWSKFTQTPAWWKPQDIRRGYYTGTEGFEPKHFWVDEETNTVYFHQFF